MSDKIDTTNMGFVILISIVATIGGFLFGFDSGVINGTVDGLSSAFGSNSAGTGFAVASMLLGCAAGAFFAGTLADRAGRRSILIVAAVFFSVSAWGSGIAQGTAEFIVYRLIGGLAVGAASVLAPAYISEVAPAKYRGTLSSIQQIAIISGLFVSALSNFVIAKTAGGSTSEFALGFDAWRWMFWIELAPSILFFFALLLIPESPRFLVATGKKDKAVAVLARLMGAEHAEAKYEEINNSLAGDHHKPRLKDIVDSNYGVRPIVWVGIGLAVFQQFVGINVVFYYSAVVWQAAGFSEGQALLTTVITNGFCIAACVVATVLVDKVGRKPLLLIGSIGMAISLGIIAFVFATAGVVEGNLALTSATGPIALVSLIVYAVFFNVSWGPIMWVMLGEMFPNQIRGSALAIAGLAQWGANFLVTWSFPMLLAAIGLGGAYGLYTAGAVISIFFVIKYVKETKGIELEDMEG
ncbi:MFS transporter, SP family, sugar:H+ symporter [Neorhodopirellula lusitana]|uniref:MFS transporter, SP family, sugar:H+ symporter n=1 Tax=Neorhodopirellula lusitana TaxID=445327 RepID=A0ABY1QTC4_9BACT|nr:sugar porter family MFS transporter [Neorhodopirellula lusitana]SMP78487.1 MFS transporter, SP family, sugar:H+ symporter [Neorhodopirellula lusitana]